MNKNCNCNKPAGIGQIPCTPAQITLRTVVLPANLGDDTTGAPYAPRLGLYYNTVVQYQANGATYIYDSNGIYTLVEPGNYAELVAKVDGLEEVLTALQTKEQEDVDNLQTNINQLANKEAEDVENLQTNINEVANDLAEYKNSPDVRFIEPTYAALEALDKTGIGDKDYARVLQDENHDDASTYYQYDLATETWNYVGEVGEYYTKQQIDAQVQTLTNNIDAIDTEKLNSLADIKTIGSNLVLSAEGELSAIGGGEEGTYYNNAELTYMSYPDSTPISLIANPTEAQILTSTTQLTTINATFRMGLSDFVPTTNTSGRLYFGYYLGGQRSLLQSLDWDKAIFSGDNPVLTLATTLRIPPTSTPQGISFYIQSDSETVFQNGLFRYSYTIQKSYTTL